MKKPVSAEIKSTISLSKKMCRALAGDCFHLHLFLRFMHQKGKPKYYKAKLQQIQLELYLLEFSHHTKNNLSNKTFYSELHSHTPSNSIRDMIYPSGPDSHLPKVQVFLCGLQQMHGQNRQELG